MKQFLRYAIFDYHKKNQLEISDKAAYMKLEFC